MPKVTPALILILSVAFAVEAMSGALESWDRVVALGALTRDSLEPSQWYRFATASLLHVNGTHFLANSVALLTLGTYFERQVGGARYLLILVFSALGGTLASFTIGIIPEMVGASTMVFGVVGGLAVLVLRYGSRTRLGSVAALSLLVVFAICWSLPVAVDSVDHAAHIGALVVGGSVMFILARRCEYTDFGSPSPRLRWAAIIALTAFSAMLSVGVWRAGSAL